MHEYEDGSQEFYDMHNDPYEWENLAGGKKYEKEIKELQKFIPEKQAVLSPYSSYDFNEYFISLTNRK